MFYAGVLLILVINIGNSETSLLLFLKGHVDKHVNCDGMFKYLGKVSLINVT